MVEINGTHAAVHSRVAHGREREALWRLVNDNYNGYAADQDRASERLIPIVVLEPGKESNSGERRGGRDAVQDAQRCLPLG